MAITQLNIPLITTTYTTIIVINGCDHEYTTKYH